jgi:GT2 family glycosyltransferase
VSAQSQTSEPKIVLILTVHNPGWWFKESLEALAALDYQELLILVVDSSESDDFVKEIAEVWPDAYIKRVVSTVNYSQALNSALFSVEGATHYLICHDDVAPEPEALSYMIAQMYKSNAGVVMPKYLNWYHPEVLESLGLNCDRLGVVSSRIEPEEIDQGQHDVETEINVFQGGMLLLRADLVKSLAGFDEAIELIGEDLDFSWRAKLAGAKLVLEPKARVRHLFASLSGERDSDVHGFELYRKSELRTLLSTYRGLNLIFYLCLTLLFSSFEIGLSFLRGKKQRARAITNAIKWNFSNYSSAKLKRQSLKNIQLLSFHKFKKSLLPSGRRFINYLENFVIHTGKNPYIDQKFKDYQFVSKVRHPVTYVFYLAILIWFVISTRNSFSAGIAQVGALHDFASLGNSVNILLASASFKTVSLVDYRQLYVMFYDLIAFNHPGLARELFLLSLPIAGAVGIVKLIESLSDLTTFKGAICLILSFLMYLSVPVVFQSWRVGDLAILSGIALAPYYELVLINLAKILLEKESEFLKSKPVKQFLILQLTTLIISPRFALIEMLYVFIVLVFLCYLTASELGAKTKKILILFGLSLLINITYYLELLIKLPGDLIEYLGTSQNLGLTSYLQLSIGNNYVSWLDICFLLVIAVSIFATAGSYSKLMQAQWVGLMGFLGLSYLIGQLSFTQHLVAPGVIMVIGAQSLLPAIVFCAQRLYELSKAARLAGFILISLVLIINLSGFYSSFINGSLNVTQSSTGNLFKGKALIAKLSISNGNIEGCPDYDQVIVYCIGPENASLGTVELYSFNKKIQSNLNKALELTINNETRFAGSLFASSGIKELIILNGNNFNAVLFQNALSDQFDLKLIKLSQNAYIIQEAPAKIPLPQQDPLSIIVLLQIIIWLIVLYKLIKA